MGIIIVLFVSSCPQKLKSCLAVIFRKRQDSSDATHHQALRTYYTKADSKDLKGNKESRFPRKWSGHAEGVMTNRGAILVAWIYAASTSHQLRLGRFNLEISLPMGFHSLSKATPTCRTDISRHDLDSLSIVKLPYIN